MLLLIPDTIFLAAAAVAAFFVRLNVGAPSFGWVNAAISMAVALVLQNALLTVFGLNRAWRWRMRGADLPRYAAVFALSAGVLLLLRLLLPSFFWARPPYSVTLIDMVFGFVAIVAFRFLRERYCLDKYDPLRLVGRRETAVGAVGFAGQTVMVTGAGGSIGSEIVRQAVASGAKRVLMVERSENALYKIELEVRGEGRIPLMVDINEGEKVAAVIETYRPDIIFHAAAYKHVPMCEWNADEARRNNVEATAQLVEIARRFAVKRLVLISTDKAVKPTSVMGKTKREAERLVLAAGYTCVRFGNVFGSSGSVIELWQEQIAKGGPLTVTDRRMTRYFMSVREAVGLVFVASTMKPGNVYVLDMGRPKSILKMAELMIRRAGYRPYADIGIEFVGIRPGEKLEEELGIDDARCERTADRRIYCIPGAAKEG